MIRAKPYLRAVTALFRKDLLAELRKREIITAMLVFALLAIFLFSFALELDANARSSTSAGVLWITFIFSGTLGLNRSFASEKDAGCMDGLLLAPIDRTAIYFSKMAASLLLMLLTAAIILPIYTLLFNINVLNLKLLGVLLLGFWGYTAAGTLLASMTVQARTRDILLPILLFPVLIPLLLAAVRATTGILQGAPAASTRIWLDILIVYDLVFTALPIMVFDYVLQE